MRSRLLELPVAFRDACAADLRLHLGLPPQPALATRQVSGDGWTACLRVLGASHQVVVEHDGQTICSETVACHLAGEGIALEAVPLEGPEYEFHATVVRLSPVDFRHRVENLIVEHAGDPRAVCARFPGEELGVTAVRIDPVSRRAGSCLSWRTWHTYPRAGDVVATSSRTALRGTLPAGPT